MGEIIRCIHLKVGKMPLKTNNFFKLLNSATTYYVVINTAQFREGENSNWLDISD
jgi:hypothetical protein